MNRRSSIISIVVVLVFIVVGVFGINAFRNYQSSELNKTIINAIIRDEPSLSYKGQPVIEVASVKHLEGKWYIAAIKSIHEATMTVPVKVLLTSQDVPHGLRVVLGPDTHFSSADIAPLNLPRSVILELQK